MAGSDHRGESAPELRRTWARSDRPVPRRVVRPLQAFLETEASSGVLLLVAAIVALLWANSPWSASYGTLWHTELTVRIGSYAISQDLLHWVNEGLMSLFFFVVGLEIKRELTTGELRDRRAAAAPVIAAVGGMVVPALIYLAINAGGPGERGWGIPMATDIAFAMGVLAITARHAPASLRLFLLTLAIVDDIGAILVIAVFYTADLSLPPLLLAAVLVVVGLLLRRVNVRAMAIYLVLGLAIWLAVYESGVHATIAGALLGLLTPSIPFQRPRAVSEEARRIADATVDDPYPPDADASQWLRLAEVSREAVSPLARLESGLHLWVSWLIVPLFALANAGVPIHREDVAGAATSPITIGIVLGLVVGKTLGITGATWLAVRMGWSRLPEGLALGHVVGGAAVAGIGFTVSLFIAELAFTGEILDTAKVGILVASVVASLLGYLLLARLPERTAQQRLRDEAVLVGEESG